MNTAGLSRARLDRMHDVMAGYVERGEVPGLVTLVSRRGEVHVDVLGTQAFADPTPIRLDFSQSTGHLSRFLDPGLPGDRRLRHLIWNR